MFARLLWPQILRRKLWPRGPRASKLTENSWPLFVYNFCFCMPRSRATEECLSNRWIMSRFDYFYYTGLPQNNC
jgi:hypothetical protein